MLRLRQRQLISVACPFVNAIGELGDNADRDIKRIARDFKEARRIWFRERLRELDVANADELATQFAILVDGAIAANVVRGDKSAARAAKQLARVLLREAGVKLDGDTKAQTNPQRHTRA